MLGLGLQFSLGLGLSVGLVLVFDLVRFLLQGTFPTRGLNPCLLHWWENSLLLSHLGSTV